MVVAVRACAGVVMVTVAGKEPGVDEASPLPELLCPEILGEKGTALPVALYCEPCCWLDSAQGEVKRI